MKECIMALGLLFIAFGIAKLVLAMIQKRRSDRDGH